MTQFHTSTGVDKAKNLHFVPKNALLKAGKMRKVECNRIRGRGGQLMYVGIEDWPQFDKMLHTRFLLVLICARLHVAEMQTGGPC